MTVFDAKMENRLYERIPASIRVSYTHIPKTELLHVLSNPSYRGSTADLLPELSKKSPAVQAVTHDISNSGLCLTGGEPFHMDQALEIQLHLPSLPAPLTLIAEVVRAQKLDPAGGKPQFRGGIKILAINRDDMVRLDEYLLAEKVRRDNAGE